MRERFLACLGLLALLVGSCLWVMTAWPDIETTLRQRTDERQRRKFMAKLHGNVEVVVPAERNPRWNTLSPDGRWMIITFEGSNWVLRDLATGTETKLKIDCKSLYEIRWLDAVTFVATDTFPGCYYVIDALSLLKVQLEYLSEEDQSRFREVLEHAGRVYDVGDFGGHPGHHLIALALDFKAPLAANYAIYSGTNEGQKFLESLLQDIPHIARNQYAGMFVRGKKYFSPDGQFYAMEPRSGLLQLYSKDGHLLDEAYREGYFLCGDTGWAYDSSGVFFQLCIYGSKSAVWHPERPILKLLVPTPTPEP